MSEKINIKPRAIMQPAPAIIASAYDEDEKADACTLAFAAMCSHNPPCIMIAINTTAKRKTLKDIHQTMEFVVGIPSTTQVAQTDYLGIASGYDEDKIEKVGFTTTKARYVNAPVIDQMKVSVECKVVNMTEVGSHTQIIGEIVNIQADEDVLEDGKISMKKVDPIVYDDVLYDYFKVGEKVDDAFKPGLYYKD